MVRLRQKTAVSPATRRRRIIDGSAQLRAGLLPSPIAALEYYLESRGFTRRALEPFIGPPHRVSEIMNRRRRLTLDMIRRLELGTGIPASVLIQPYELAQEANPAAQRKFSSYLQPVAVT